MAVGKLLITLLAGVTILTIFVTTFNLHRSRLEPPSRLFLYSQPDPNYSLQTQHHQEPINLRHVTSVDNPIDSVSILLPDWEVLSLTLSALPPKEDYTCHFPNNLTSHASKMNEKSFGNPKSKTERGASFMKSFDKPKSIKERGPYQLFGGVLRCELPTKLRQRLPFPQPMITNSMVSLLVLRSPPPDLLRWDRMVYGSLTTDNDVIVFAKGINRRQGSHGSPSDFGCVFVDNNNNAVKTTVTTSAQEVFRCKLPEEVNTVNSVVKVSLEYMGQNIVVPSVAYYTPLRKIDETHTKSLLCACTMVYNVAKFLKEWVVYHSSIGVERFILYDNNSEDELNAIVDELVGQGYDVSTLLWIWPKTQEAGFSHCATFAKDTCTWMMYTDVDEFVYSPSWTSLPNPSTHMLKSILPHSESNLVGQLMINCYEFGPSNQKTNPVMGVTQGYNYRRQIENRHKSIVLLDAIDESLLNVIHHFKLKENYESRRVGKDELLVNHYKYQAWPEFRIKFRRRVSAYVADWTKAVNLASKDRAPGLGYTAVEPEGWTQKYCEVNDDRLKDLTQRWFMKSSSDGYKMAWQQNTRSLA